MSGALWPDFMTRMHALVFQACVCGSRIARLSQTRVARGSAAQTQCRRTDASDPGVCTWVSRWRVARARLRAAAAHALGRTGGPVDQPC